MTETWLNDNILDLDNYWILRTDRDITSTNKSQGGGLLFYIYDKWCNDGTIVSTHLERTLETMAIKQ